jgi:hypothetical protein
LTHAHKSDISANKVHRLDKLRTTNWRDHLEWAANSAILVVALLLVYRFVDERFMRATQGEPTLHLESVAGGNASRQSIVLAYSSDCSPCRQSLPFYRELSSRARHLGIPIIVVTQDPVEQVHAALEGVDAEVQHRSLAALGVKATPTLAVRSPAGTVSKVWQGYLSSERQAEVLSEVGRAIDRP